jgi:uncharacterized protein YbaP (TraB family)
MILFKIIKWLLFCLALIEPAFASENRSSFEFKDAAPTEILVVGLRPGPELWKVEKDGRVLWILGTISPIPKAMKWHSLLVEHVLQDSQELILPPFSKANIGFFKGLSLAPSMIGVKKSPEGKVLKDVVSPELYERWLILKSRYLGRDGSIEGMRPLFAAEKLFKSAVSSVGLETEQPVVKKVRKIAQENKIPIVTPVVLFDFQNPKKTIKQFKQTAINDQECFAKTLSRLESDLDIMRVRANAWANGNIGLLTELKVPNQSEECSTAFLDSAVVKNSDLGGMPTRLKNAWVDAAKLSLNKNKSTFAVLPIELFYGANGYLSALEGEGYVIITPK